MKGSVRPITVMKGVTMALLASTVALAPGKYALNNELFLRQACQANSDLISFFVI